MTSTYKSQLKIIYIYVISLMELTRFKTRIGNIGNTMHTTDYTVVKIIVNRILRNYF